MKQAVREPENYQDFCYICGFTLPKTDLAADICGDFVDYNKRVRGNITFSICTECWDKLITNTEGGLESAIKRSRIFKNELNE